MTLIVFFIRETQFLSGLGEYTLFTGIDE